MAYIWIQLNKQAWMIGYLLLFNYLHIFIQVQLHSHLKRIEFKKSFKIFFKKIFQETSIWINHIYLHPIKHNIYTSKQPWQSAFPPQAINFAQWHTFFYMYVQQTRLVCPAHFLLRFLVLGEFELRLNIEPDEYVDVVSPERGAIVFIHSRESEITDGSRHLVAPASHYVIDLQKVRTNFTISTRY